MITNQIALSLAVMTGGVGFVIGYLIRILVALSTKNSLELNAKKIKTIAKEEAVEIISRAQNDATEIMSDAKKEIKEKEENIQKNEDRLIKKEQMVDSRQIEVEKDIKKIDEEIEKIRSRKNKLSEDEEQLKILKDQESLVIERISGLTNEEAKKIVFDKIEKDSADDLVNRMNKFDLFAEDSLEDKAREILTTVVQRLASSVNAEIFSSAVQIPSEDIKGKVIGKEGRNIKTFEKETGVEVLVDEGQGYITLSCFDPIRRQVAKIALEALIADGRIQPARIEKEVEMARDSIIKETKKLGSMACYETGVVGLDPRISTILGRLQYRTSYGQNVLQHSIECCHLAGMLAEELGADVAVAKAGALLHDIGKALDHEVTGSHVDIGKKLLEKMGVDKKIIQAMQSHHDEYPYETLEARIVQTADALSGGRPGARSDTMENYIKRLNDLEDIANSFSGVEKSYALQAGREIRIFVSPEKISDYDAKNIARNIAIKIERTLKYPGEIKVTVIRENKIVEIAR
ncbi:MAG: ribonuclease Y [bacterium]